MTTKDRDCTCIGSCRGSAGLAERWRCVMEASSSTDRVAARTPEAICKAAETKNCDADCCRAPECSVRDFPQGCVYDPDDQ